MTDLPRLPPIYRLVVVPANRDVRVCALEAAGTGAEPATIFWSEGAERFDAAVVLAPDTALGKAAEVLFCAALALGDAIAGLIPPGIDVEFAWPGFVRINARTAGMVGLYAPAVDPNAVPDWVVLTLSVAIDDAPADMARDAAEVTTLAHEGCWEITAVDLVGAVARHLLSWIHRWQVDGFPPVREAWAARAHRNDKNVSFDMGQDRIRGRFAGLGDDGVASIETVAGRREIPIVAAVAR